MPTTVDKSDTLRLLCWEGYDNPALLEPFAQRHGIETHAETLLADWDAATRIANGEHTSWDVLNINNAYIANYLYPRGLIRRLDASRFERYADDLLQQFARLYRWTRSEDGALLGICQRFGPFNLVVNTRRVSRASAEDEGFELANDPSARQRFGILYYEDFNLFHICIGAGVNPFEQLDKGQLAACASTAQLWFETARVVSDDHYALNKALIGGEIDFYLSGGIYTASSARLAGHREVTAITPRTGPIDGRGGIVFAEISSVLEHPGVSAHAEDFLEYLLSPEAAVHAAFAPGTCNPVAQMANPSVRAAFSAEQLDAIQWDSLEEDIARCADYDIVPAHNELRAVLRAAHRSRLKHGSDRFPCRPPQVPQQGSS